jgi:hypothetical protein
MKVKDFLVYFAITFVVVFVVNAIVVYLYNVIVHGQGAFDWGTTFSLAIMLGIVFPLSEVFRKRK